MDGVRRLAKKAWDGYFWRMTGLTGVYLVGGWAKKKWDKSEFDEEMCRRAMPVGDGLLESPTEDPYRLQVVVNWKSGQGSVRDLWDANIRPVFQYAAHVYDDRFVKVFVTKEPETAKEEMAALDLSKIDGLCVIGGDGVMQEVVTGLMRRPDREAVSKLPIGIVPAGSANMLASALHKGEMNDNAEGRAGWAALAVALGKTRKVDVLELTTDEGETVYALSALGWGTAGLMVSAAEKQAWLRSHRYWYGGAVSTIYERPDSGTASRVRLMYPKVAGSDVFSEGEEATERPGWVARDLNVSALTATKVPTMAIGCYVNPSAAVDDGLVTLTWLPSESLSTRHQMFSLGYRLSKGNAIAEEPGAQTVRVPEFAVQVSPDSPAISVDGEAFDPRSVHVRVLPGALTMFTM